METINNFDQSSTRTSLDLCFGRNEELWRTHFEDNIERISGQECVYFYTDYSNEQAPAVVAECYDFSKCAERDFKEFVCRSCLHSKVKGDWVDWTLEDILQEKEDFHATWEDFAQTVIDDILWLDIRLDGFPIIKGAKLLYGVTNISGHSRGDYTILYKLDDSYDQSGLTDYFEHLFFDSPIYCRLEVGDTEYYFDTEIKDIYEWDRDELLHIARETHKLPNGVIGWLEEQLPEYL